MLAQTKTPEVVYLTGEQALLRAAEVDEAVQLKLRQYNGFVFFVGSGVNQTTVIVEHIGDSNGCSLEACDLLSYLVLHPADGGVVFCISAPLSGGGKAQSNTAIGIFYDNAETELGFGVADPALAEGIN